MPLDAISQVISAAGTPEQRIAARIADLERRLTTLERSRPAIQVVDTTPTSTVREGGMAADKTHNYLWLYLNGSWQFTALT